MNCPDCNPVNGVHAAYCPERCREIRAVEDWAERHLQEFERGLEETDLQRAMREIRVARSVAPPGVHLEFEMPDAFFDDGGPA